MRSAARCRQGVALNRPRVNQRMIALMLELTVAGFGTIEAGAQCIDTTGFIQISGSDTLILERVESAQTGVRGLQRSVDGTVSYRLQRLSSRRMTLDLGIWVRAADTSGQPTQVGSLVVEGSAAKFTVSSKAATQVQRDSFPTGGFILLDGSVGLEEQMIRAARKQNLPRVVAPAFFVASGGYRPTIILNFRKPDSVVYAWDDSSRLVHARIDSVGRILSAHIRGRTREINITRLGCAVVDSLLARNK